MSDESEITTLTSYVVYVEGSKPVAVTDSFLSAVEAAEAHALELSRQVDEKAESVSVLTDGTEPDAEGFFARWEKFDEDEEEAELYVFHRYRKPDGYLISGAWRQKPLPTPTIKVTSVPLDLFAGVYVSFEDADDISEEGGSALAESDDDSDSGDDDRTYVDGEN